MWSTPGRKGTTTRQTVFPLPASFAGGRYQVKKFLGEGGKKKVYLAHDTVLDRDVAFALIKTEKLDEVARTRIKREARAMGKLGVKRPGSGTAEDMTAAYLDNAYLEVAVLVGHQRSAELLLKRLVKCSQYNLEGSCVARNLGGAAALLGKYGEARKYYQEAIRICTEMRFRPELALSRLQLAELLLEHYPDEKKEALEHLDFAIREFREMKMQPSLERALRHKDILKA